MEVWLKKKIVNCLLDDICHLSVAESGTKRDRAVFLDHDVRTVLFSTLRWCE
jgi:hypothetical protein